MKTIGVFVVIIIVGIALTSCPSPSVSTSEPTVLSRNGAVFSDGAFTGRAGFGDYINEDDKNPAKFRAAPTTASVTASDGKTRKVLLADWTNLPTSGDGSWNGVTIELPKALNLGKYNALTFYAKAAGSAPATVNEFSINTGQGDKTTVTPIALPHTGKISLGRDLKANTGSTTVPTTWTKYIIPFYSNPKTILSSIKHTLTVESVGGPNNKIYIDNVKFETLTSTMPNVSAAEIEDNDGDVDTIGLLRPVGKKRTGVIYSRLNIGTAAAPVYLYDYTGLLGTWTSLNDKVITIAKGVLTLVSRGEAFLTGTVGGTAFTTLSKKRSPNVRIFAIPTRPPPPDTDKRLYVYGSNAPEIDLPELSMRVVTRGGADRSTSTVVQSATGGPHAAGNKLSTKYYTITNKKDSGAGTNDDKYARAFFWLQYLADLSSYTSMVVYLRVPSANAAPNTSVNVFLDRSWEGRSVLVNFATPALTTSWQKYTLPLSSFTKDPKFRYNGRKNKWTIKASRKIVFELTGNENEVVQIADVYFE